MPGSGARVALPALGVLALVAVVAIAASGSTPGGSSDSRRPGDLFFDTIFSLVLLALIPAAALLVYGLMQRKEIAREVASGRYRRTSLGAFLVFCAIFGVVVYFRMRDKDWSFLGANGPGEPPLLKPFDGTAAGQPEIKDTYEPEFAWLPVLVLLILVSAGVGAWYLAGRRERAARRNEPLAETLAEAIDESLDDLVAEVDPRRAVIAAYARLERALAAYGLPRDSAETQEEYFARILGNLDVGTQSIRRLTDLFERAKYSQHDVDGGMKEEAIAALTQVRDELRAAEELRTRQPGIPATVERA
jgi:di/tricarboxylate transporter